MGSPISLDDIETQGGGGLTASAWIYQTSNVAAGYPDVIVNKSVTGFWEFMVYSSLRLGFGKDYATQDLWYYHQSIHIPLIPGTM